MSHLCKECENRKMKIKVRGFCVKCIRNFLNLRLNVKKKKCLNNRLAFLIVFIPRYNYIWSHLNNICYFTLNIELLFIIS